MNRTFVTAVLASSTAMMALGFLLYGVLFKSLFEEGAITLPGVAKEPSMGWIIGGQVAFGFLLTLVVSWRGAKTFGAGLSTGAVFGLLMAIGIDFPQYGTTHLWTLRATLMDPLITMTLVAIPGGVAGWILGRSDH